MKICNQCSTTDKSKFGQSNSRCKPCSAKINLAHWNKKKKEERIARQARIAKLKICQDTFGLVLADPTLFKPFCQARRVQRGSSEMMRLSYCNECGLHDKVDDGFVPLNIIIKPELLLRVGELA